MKSQERKKEKKFSRGGSSSGKRPRESQVDSIQGSATRGRRQGPTMTQSSGRGTSIGQDERQCMTTLPQISSWYLQTGNWRLFSMWEHRSCDSQLSARIQKFKKSSRKW